MKRTPLIRKTPLRAKTRLAPRGTRYRRWAAWQAECRAIVAERAGGKCEACGKPDGPSLEFAHLLGRRNIISEPWASDPACTAMLCRECHRLVDSNRDPELRDRLRWEAVIRLQQCAKAAGVLRSTWLPDDPIGAARLLVGLLTVGAPA